MQTFDLGVATLNEAEKIGLKNGTCPGCRDFTVSKDHTFGAVLDCDAYRCRKCDSVFVLPGAK
jgi:DNA polymerase III alpha subunit (gram-positive type)